MCILLWIIGEINYYIVYIYIQWLHLLTTGSGRAAYNQLSEGTWSLNEVVNGDYVLSHVLVSNDTDRPFMVIIGQSLYTNSTAARIGAENEINTLILADIPFAEFKFIGTLIIQTNNGYSNVVKSRILSTADGSDYIDLIGELITRGGVSAAVVTHDNLSGVYLATTGITYGHIDDQTQTIYGSKTFNSTITTPATITTISTANVSNPPTDTELDSVLGEPGTVGSGYMKIINDNGDGNNVYLCVSDGTNWWYTTMSKAT